MYYLYLYAKIYKYDVHIFIYINICIYLYAIKIYISPVLTLAKKIRKCYTLMKQEGKIHTNNHKTRFSKFFTQKSGI